MFDSIEQARGDVQRAVDDLLEWSDWHRRRSLCEFERELWVRMLVLGRALVALFFARHVARPAHTISGRHVQQQSP